MFNKIETPEPAQGATPVASEEKVAKRVSYLKLQHLLFQTLKSASAIRQSMATLDRATESFKLFNNIRHVVATEGLSRPMVAMLKMDPASTKLFSSLPELNRLDAVSIRPSDRRVQTLLAEMDETVAIESVMVGDWIHGSMDHLTCLFNTLREQLCELAEVTKDLEEDLTEGEVPESAFSEITCHVATADALIKKAESLTHVTIHLDTPSSKDAEDWSLEKLVAYIADCVGAYIDANGCVCADPSKVTEEFQCAEGTLADRGFTAEKLCTLLHGVGALASELVALSEKHQDICAYLKAQIAAIGGEAPAEEGEPAPAPEPAPQPEPAPAPAPAAAPAMPTHTPGAEPALELDDTILGNDLIDPAGNKTVDGGINAAGVPAEEEEDAKVDYNEVRDCIKGYLSFVVIVVEHATELVCETLRLAEALDSEEEESEEEEPQMTQDETVVVTTEGGATEDDSEDEAASEAAKATAEAEKLAAEQAAATAAEEALKADFNVTLDDLVSTEQ